MKRRDEVLVGLLLVVAVVVAIGGTIWIARGGLRSGYPLYARFPWGAGLKQGQPVLLAGVQVGFVDRVELIPDGTLGIAMTIQSQYKVPVGTTASVQANGIFGDQLIALTPVRASTNYIAEGDTVPMGAASPGIPQLLSKGDSIAVNALALSNRVRAEFVDSGGIADIRTTIGLLTKLVGQISQVTADQSRQLTATQTALRRTIASIDSVKVDSTVRNLQVASANLEKLSRDVNETNARVQSVIDKVGSGNGTAGKLLNDPAVYDQLEKSLMRIDSLIIDIKKNPRKYINLRIF